MLRSAGLIPSTSKVKALRKKLLFAECLSAEIKNSLNVNPRQRNIISAVASGTLMKKYRQFSMLKQSTNINWRSCNIKSKTITTSLRRRKKEITQRITKDVAHFLARDDNSRMMPGKADAIKEKERTKIQKRILNDYMHNLHLKFASEHT